jgi:hypothetical protein
VVVREFAVVEGRERDFEKVFGREGLWPDFLRRLPQYLGTALRLELQGYRRRRYKVFDYWHSHEDFESFRREHQMDLGRFSLLIASEDLIESEIVLGSFYQDDSDFDDGTDTVPS